MEMIAALLFLTLGVISISLLFRLNYIWVKMYTEVEKAAVSLEAAEQTKALGKLQWVMALVVFCSFIGAVVSLSAAYTVVVQ